jgi:hypothetical protein
VLLERETRQARVWTVYRRARLRRCPHFVRAHAHCSTVVCCTRADVVADSYVRVFGEASMKPHGDGQAPCRAHNHISNTCG